MKHRATEQQRRKNILSSLCCSVALCFNKNKLESNIIPGTIELLRAFALRLFLACLFLPTLIQAQTTAAPNEESADLPNTSSPRNSVFSQSTQKPFDIKGGIVGNKKVKEGFFDTDVRSFGNHDSTVTTNPEGIPSLDPSPSLSNAPPSNSGKSQPLKGDAQDIPPPPGMEQPEDSFSQGNNSSAHGQQKLPEMPDIENADKQEIINRVTWALEQMKQLQNAKPQPNPQPPVISLPNQNSRRAPIVQPQETSPKQQNSSQTSGIESTDLMKDAHKKKITGEIIVEHIGRSLQNTTDASKGPRLSLIVSAVPRDHLIQNLKKLEQIHRTQKVKIGRLVIADNEKDNERKQYSFLPPPDPSGPVLENLPASFAEYAHFLTNASAEDFARLNNSFLAATVTGLTKGKSPAQLQQSLEGMAPDQVEGFFTANLDSRAKRFLNMLENLSPQQEEKLQLIMDVKSKEIAMHSADVPEDEKMLLALDVKPVSSVSLATLLNHMGANTSPIWIVQDQGEEHIFEGETQPSTLFNAYGDFLGGGESLSKTVTDGVPVIHHRRIDGIAFPQEIYQGQHSFNVRVYQPAGVPEQSAEDDLKDLPNCEKPQVIRSEVFHHSLTGDALDIVFYAQDDPVQVAAAKEYRGRTQACKNNPFQNSSEPSNNRDRAGLQTLPYTLKVKCLPTRFHFVNSENKRYMEYREGENAWVVDAPQRNS